MAITYTPDKPGIYLSTSIFNRDTDGDPQASIKIVPAVGSLVIFPDYVMKQVIAVDNNYNSATYLKVTYGDVLTSYPDPDMELINYGRDVLMLYYDRRQSPTRIVVDTKLRLHGNNTIGYRILKTINGERVVISSRLNINGQIESDIIPVSASGADKALIWGTGHCLFNIEAGDLLFLELVDSAGVITGEATLIAKEATILNTLHLASNPIVGFDAECSQIEGDYWLLYTKQNIEELSIHPYVTYADGTRRIVPVDSATTFMYGWEDVYTTTNGAIYELVFKYYLGRDELTTLDIDSGDGTRFITMKKSVKIVARDIRTYSKISPVPIWNSSTSKYSMKYIGYNEERTDSVNITTSVKPVQGYVFTPNAYNQQKEIRINIGYTDDQGGTHTYSQTYFLTLTVPGQPEPFLIRATADGVAYGSNQNNISYFRPVVYYDTTLQKYFIPTTTFKTADQFIRNFYTTARPPYLIYNNETEAPRPTHFMFRDPTTDNLRPLSVIIDVEDYENVFTLNPPTGTNQANAFVNKTVLLEWMIKSGNNYSILYGVPVEVLASATGYVG